MTEVLQVAAIVVGSLTFVCATVAVVFAYANKGRMDRLSVENHELRETVKFMREEHRVEKDKATQDIADLRAQVDFLRGKVVDELVDSFRDAVVNAMHQVLDTVEQREA